MNILSSLGGQVYVDHVLLSDCREAAREGREYALDRLQRGTDAPVAWPLDEYLAEGRSPAAALFLTRVFNGAAMRVLREHLHAETALAVAA